MKLLVLALFLAGIANAKFVNQVTIISHSYKVDRGGDWEASNVAATLRDTEKTNGIVSFSGDIEGVEYQFKRDTETDKNIVQKLFYIADVNDNLSVQFGKFSENWQLGYAFNPLGLTDPYHPANNDDDLNEKLGINAVVVRYSMEDVHLDFYTSNDNKERNNVRGHGYKSQAVHLNYLLSDETDITMVAHKKEEVKLGVGAGFRSIVNDNSKVYGSFFTRKGTTIPSVPAPIPMTAPPPLTDRTKDGKQYTHAMLGWHWTSDNNFSIIAETSQDDRGLSDSEYQNMNIAYLTLVRPVGIRQQYNFLRVSKVMGEHEFSLARRMSSDDSALNTFKWRYDINDNLQLNASYSETTGGADGEYKAYFPDQSNTQLILYYNLDF